MCKQCLKESARRKKKPPVSIWDAKLKLIADGAKRREGIKRAEALFEKQRASAGLTAGAMQYNRTAVCQGNGSVWMHHYTAFRVVTNEEVMQAMRDDGLDVDNCKVSIVDTYQARFIA